MDYDKATIWKVTYVETLRLALTSKNLADAVDAAIKAANYALSQYGDYSKYFAKETTNV